MTAHQEENKRIWLGVILVAGGLALLLNNLDIIPIHIPRYLISWKIFLIALGSYFLFVKKRAAPGVIMITIGTVFLLHQDFHLFYIRNIWEVLIPTIIIVAGASLVLRKSGSSWGDEKKKDRVDHLSELALFGGRKRNIDSQNFEGGNVTVLFGGTELNFSKAQLNDGSNVLDIMVIFGGCDITVPYDWSVKIEVTSLFGGFEDDRSSPIDVVPNPDKTLVIKGLVLFGGGEVKLSKA